MVGNAGDGSVRIASAALGAAGAYRLGLVRRLPRLLCVALFLTCFTVAGVVNSFNIIDGMNGLASMCAF